LEPSVVIARHVWRDGTTFDLFADPQRALDEVGRVFGGRDRAAYAAFRQDARRIYETIEEPFLRSPAPTLRSMMKEALHDFGALARIGAHRSMMRDLEGRFQSPKLAQLFGRYATYCGSSPYDAPATLNLVSHVEAMGVYRVSGGVAALAQAMRSVASAHGATFRFGAVMTAVLDGAAGARGVRLQGGEELAADAVVFNGDIAALAEMTERRAVVAHRSENRSFSAVTWAAVARATGVPLAHHNVFFSDDYRAEFEALRALHVPAQPTVYLCAQDRGDAPRQLGPERMLLIVNAPATGMTPRGGKHWRTNNAIERHSNKSSNVGSRSRSWRAGAAHRGSGTRGFRRPGDHSTAPSPVARCRRWRGRGRRPSFRACSWPAAASTRARAFRCRPSVEPEPRRLRSRTWLRPPHRGRRVSLALHRRRE
jgi:1-hydroxycarotenoid 3,4-desaturase